MARPQFIWYQSPSIMSMPSHNQTVYPQVPIKFLLMEKRLLDQGLLHQIYSSPYLLQALMIKTDKAQGMISLKNAVTHMVGPR